MCHSSRERLNRLNHYKFKIFVCHWLNEWHTCKCAVLQFDCYFVVSLISIPSGLNSCPLPWDWEVAETEFSSWDSLEHTVQLNQWNCFRWSPQNINITTSTWCCTNCYRTHGRWFTCAIHYFIVHFSCFLLSPSLSLSLSSLFLSGIFKSLPIDVSGVEEEDDADDDPILHESTTK